MKIIFPFLLFLALINHSTAQTIFKDSIAPKIEFTEWINNSKGNNVLKGKPIVLEFWATWCGPCVAAIPHFNELTEKYKENITFISVNSYETSPIVEAFLLENSMSSYVALDENKKLYKAFNIQTIPVTIIIDKWGNLRWRGITTDLTDDLLATFLSENTFKEVYNKGIILDENYLVNTLNLKYNLRIEYGDRTLGKGVRNGLKDYFVVKLSNQDIYSILPTFSDGFKLGYDWKFQGKPSEEMEVVNLSIQTDSISFDKEATKMLIEDVILKLADTFHFTIESSEEIKEIWYVQPDTTQLKNYLSVNQTLDASVTEKTETYTSYKNMFFDYLAYNISSRTKVNVAYDGQRPSPYFDITIPEMDNILEMKKYFKEEYGMDLIKKQVKKEVRTVIFE